MKRINNKVKFAIKTASLGAITYITKHIADELFPIFETYVANNIGYYLQCTQSRSHIQRGILEYLSNIDNKVFKNSISVFDSYATFNKTGNYVAYHNKCVYIIQNTNDNNNGTCLELKLFGPNAKSEYTNIMKRIDTIGKERQLTTYTSADSHHTTRLREFKFDYIQSSYNDYIKDILDEFKRNEEYYKRVNLKYKMGILLHGEPGTGKTTMVKAIASYLGYDIVSVNAVDISELGYYITQHNNSVILLEDIDCDMENRDGENRIIDSDGKTKSINALLNLLDGVNSPNNCIFIGTTNYYDRLDPALLRKGRFDYHIELGRLDYDLAVKMCAKFKMNPDEVLKGLQFPMNPSELQHHILEYRRNKRRIKGVK